jgi:chromosome segregation ATPase
MEAINTINVSGGFFPVLGKIETEIADSNKAFCKKLSEMAKEAHTTEIEDLQYYIEELSANIAGIGLKLEEMRDFSEKIQVPPLINEGNWKECPDEIVSVNDSIEKLQAKIYKIENAYDIAEKMWDNLEGVLSDFYKVEDLVKEIID